MLRRSTLFIGLFFVTCAWSQPVDSTQEILVEPPKEDWVMLSSTALFRKPTTLIEHRDMPKLRGFLSVRRQSLKPGQVFTERARLKDACANIRQSYAVTKTHVVVDSKVAGKAVPYCRVQVQEKDGLHVDQILFVSLDSKKARMVVTQTITFFYPRGEEERSEAAVTKFIASVGRRKNG